ncbi:response regulator transcription factor [Cohnella soli]|uniref:Helix-turn-helix domain-containing protein n=1 Tax=Cohnella soli TaxID=425005 RepID=A0ABW0HQY1_9BACL
MNKYKVLIIDDEPWSRQVVRALGDWEGHGLTIVGEAEDGTEGLLRIEQWKPHVVVTDMRMPGKDGDALLREIGQRYPNVRIIVMSGYDDFTYMKQAVRSRAVDYLLKPLDPAEFNEALANCVRGLDRERAEAGEAWAPAFARQDVHREYTAYRDRTHAGLLELNRAAVSEAFGKLAAFLSASVAPGEEQACVAAVTRDYAALLQPFLAEYELGRAADGLRNGLGDGLRDGEGLSPDLESEVSRPAAARLDGALSQAVASIARVYEDAMERAAVIRRNRNRLDLEAVRAYVDKHFLDAISLETIAQCFYVSKEHLSRAFKAHTGETVTDYMVRKRMEKARELIVEQELSIKNAAHLTGYDDIAYFYRVFKKHFGCTPGNLRGEP